MGIKVASSNLKLGYLLISSPVPNVYIGGIMVTDARGLPQEFRYTEPLQPTKIQQILYGQVLSHYIKTEVIMDTLLKSLESKCKCLLVDDENLLNASGKSGLTLLRLTETSVTPLGEIGKSQTISPTEFLLQVTKEGSPLRVYTGSKNAAQSNSSDAGASADTVGANPVEILTEAGQQMDLYEPLKRVEKALETICQEMGIPSATRS